MGEDNGDELGWVGVAIDSAESTGGGGGGGSNGFGSDRGHINCGEGAEIEKENNNKRCRERARGASGGFAAAEFESTIATVVVWKSVTGLKAEARQVEVEEEGLLFWRAIGEERKGDRQVGLLPE
uniref:Uncharacterized protein n=1 Tax=Nelumbo nucifera TaxID=4432 RepID=A0A822XMD9_NELNU|nr:TPA_asm: hypothetical protein HUJ06_022910 [Nelumbo nucifera]